jgi:hypothetical protein
MRFSEFGSRLERCELEVSSFDDCYGHHLISSFLFFSFVRVGTQFDSSGHVLSIVELVEDLEFLEDM